MRKVTRITLTLDFEFTEENKRDFQYMLSDALSDFRMVRGNDYVTRRYGDSNFSEKWLENKRLQVERRRSLSYALHNAALRPEITEVEIEED